MSGSVDAKLAAVAADNASAAAVGSGGSTPKQPGQGKLQQGSASVGAEAAAAVGHHHHHHHHHHPVSASQQPQPQRSKKEDNLLLSLPSQDREAWYDRAPATGLEQDTSDVYDDGDDDYMSASKTPRLSNRGYKLAAGAKFVRKGRLGGWENHEVFESRSAFPSNNSYPAVSTSSVAALAKSAVERKLPGGFQITPSLSLVPSSSLAAGRPDKDLSSFPVPHRWLSSTSPVSSSHTSMRKKRKSRHAYSYGALASTSSSAAAYTSAPVRAYLPVSPHNPIELVMSPLITRTFSPKNRTLEKLSLSATELIEQDIPLVKALTRLIDFMRGNSIAGRDGTIGLPFSGEEERLIQPSKKFHGHQEGVNKHEAEPWREEQIPASKQAGTELPGIVEKAWQPETDVVADITGVYSLSPEKIDETTTSQADPVADMLVDDKPEISETLASPRKRRRSEAMVFDDEAEGVMLRSSENTREENPGGHSQTKLAKAAEKSEVEASGAAAVLMGGSKGHQGHSQSGMPSSELAETAKGGANGTASYSSKDREPEGTERNDSVSRSSSPSQSVRNDDTDNSQKALAVTKLPPSVLRIANPQAYIDSLFVSKSDLTVPLVAGQGILSLPINGGIAIPNNGSMPLPVPGEEEATDRPAEGYIRLTSHEQLETVRLCLAELTRFLADSLEYQERLSEIRDQVLGVERRRKGVWNMARGYAHQLLWEEEREKATRVDT